MGERVGKKRPADQGGGWVFWFGQVECKKVSRFLFKLIFEIATEKNRLVDNGRFFFLYVCLEVVVVARTASSSRGTFMSSGEAFFRLCGSFSV
jgi:hypothetical protein